MKVYIVEDQEDIQEELVILLNRIADTDIVGRADSIKKAVKEIPKCKPDLVLMDIQLNDGNSFEILKQIPIEFHIIFITAYNHYAIKAIKVGAIDYLLKPIDADELYEAIDRLKKQTLKHTTSQQTEHLLHHLEEEKPITSLTIRTLHDIYILDLEEIVYCQGQGNYTTFFMEDSSKITSSKPLKEYRALLPENDFIQTHQSYVVNKNYIQKYSTNGELTLKKKYSNPCFLPKERKCS